MTSRKSSLNATAKLIKVKILYSKVYDDDDDDEDNDNVDDEDVL